ncbi:hypothetical protein WA026_017302 [Henosepilachna vigintioctopunctata]|uniref:Peptidoglycan-recognition protein n=1 Tax=Henosepilachna vigintioctopunctata TaxID=420089 RepID=A0AAW1UH16_9CUCU
MDSNGIFTKLLVITVLLPLFSITAGTDLPDICPEIVPRSRWGAMDPLEIDYTIIPLQYIIVHHTVTPTCKTEASCSDMLTSIQNFHMNTLDFHDIGYNFMVGGDGKIYEGAGWHKVGAHTYKFNTKSIGLAFIGNFSNALPEDISLKAAKDFIECGIRLGELDEKVKLLGAKQVSSTLSPGLKLFRELKKWKHWSENK